MEFEFVDVTIHKEIGCEDCQTQWKNRCPLCKEPARQLRDENGKRVIFCNNKPRYIVDFLNNPKKDSIVVRRKIKVQKPTKEKSLYTERLSSNGVQPMPITCDNFHIATQGVFSELKEIPDTFERFYKSKSSEYLINKDKTHIIRISDHWGFGIKNCSWFIKGYPKMHCGTWLKKTLNPNKSGIIKIANLKPNKKRNINFQ